MQESIKSNSTRMQIKDCVGAGFSGHEEKRKTEGRKDAPPEKKKNSPGSHLTPFLKPPFSSLNSASRSNDSSKGQQSTKNSGNYRRIFKFPHCGELRKAEKHIYVCEGGVCVLHVACHGSCAIINLDWKVKESKEKSACCIGQQFLGICRQDSGTAPSPVFPFFWPLACGSDKNRILFALHVNTCKLKCLNHALTHSQKTVKTRWQ